MPIVNDQAHETQPHRAPDVGGTHTNQTNPGQVALGTPNTAVLTINDNDKVPTVQFSAKAYSVTEAGKGADKIVVKRKGATGTTITVDYAATDGTAVSGTNYDLTPGTLTFDPGVTSLPIPVTIHNVADASNTTFKLELSNPVTTDNGQAQAIAELGTPSEVEVTIQSDDPLVQFSTAAYKVNEVGPKAVITVKRSGAKTAQAVVHYEASGGSATAGVDYTLTPGDLTFDPGVTTQTFDVPVTDSGLVATDQTVDLTLTPASGAGIGPIGTAVLTLVTDDPSVAFSRDGFKVAETSKSATISVRRIGNKSVPFTVQFTTTDNTAINGVNYTDSSTTLDFPKGASSRSIKIPILHDTADNPPPVTVDLDAHVPVGRHPRHAQHGRARHRRQGRGRDGPVLRLRLQRERDGLHGRHHRHPHRRQGQRRHGGLGHLRRHRHGRHQLHGVLRDRSLRRRRDLRELHRRRPGRRRRGRQQDGQSHALAPPGRRHHRSARHRDPLDRGLGVAA